ncbi:RsmB/NOP family class I SAM-dependent RNA methyltransferase [uncultured Alsobacter sp.]|uniref:RsmB/NOP family class I SAM-dependent RNA methyltransferase n=1 Tax=uncultured Alsobacter sp. TaxID=1748258 RepID=UPI0025DF672F|nr:RsmB/NOP family class I SAM-dependent RNA methyltransferase [uncultured Alsobacter sp.]
MPRPPHRPGSPSRSAAPRPAADVAGLPARRLAGEVFAAVTEQRQALDDTLDRILASPPGRALEDRDRGLVRAIATTAVRRFGTIRRVLLDRMTSGLPDEGGPLPQVLATAVAQLLFMDVPDHAAVDLAIRLLLEDKHGQRYTKLANGVLRRVGRERDAILAALDPLALDTPAWLRRRWTAAYGEDAARRLAAAHMSEAALDLTFKTPDIRDRRAAELGGLVLPTGSLRLADRAPLPSLPGYQEGDWWVQDAAAALPARLLGVGAGDKVADLCAAPGGKTAQLAAAGAAVTAVDRSAARLERLKTNMARLGLSVEVEAVDATAMAGDGLYDAVLLDAPCSATGTLRRHPDVAWTKDDQDVFRLAALQTRLLAKAVDLVRVGGRVVYCTCSLEPEEGEAQIRGLLARDDRVERRPVDPSEIGGLEGAITAEGDLRTLPFMLPDADPRFSGLDGFFAARLVRVR